jgi:hypothetical protein
MITFAIFYYLFLLVLGVFLLYSLFNIYHLLRFGFQSFVNVGIVILYIVGSTLYIWVALSDLAYLEWNRAIFNEGLYSESNFEYDR